MITKETARGGIAVLSTAIAEMTGQWADVAIAGDDDLRTVAVTARIVGSAMADIAVLASAVQVLARWADGEE